MNGEWHVVEANGSRTPIADPRNSEETNRWHEQYWKTLFPPRTRAERWAAHAITGVIVAACFVPFILCASAVASYCLGQTVVEVLLESRRRSSPTRAARAGRRRA